MNSTKCPQCGLVYWSTVPNCKRCGLATAEHQPLESPTHFMPPPADVGHQGYNSPDGYRPDASFNAGFNIISGEKEQLLNTLKKDSRLFYVIGGLQVLLWFIIGNLLIIDAVLNIGLSFLAHKFRSRVAAICLLGVTVLSVIGAIFMMMMMGASLNLFMPIAMIFRMIASIRMVYTTFRLRGFAEEDIVRVLPPPPPDFYQEHASQWGAQVGAAQ